MHRGAPLLTIVLAATLSAGTAAQQRPDFSGRWREAADTAEASGRTRRGPPSPGTMGSGWGSDLTITQDAATLTVEYMFFDRGDMQPPWRFAFALDGSETRDTIMMGRGMQERIATAGWRGDELELRIVETYPDAAPGEPTRSEVVRTLRLESPTTMMVETTRAGVLGGPSTTTRTRYIRR